MTNLTKFSVRIAFFISIFTAYNCSKTEIPETAIETIPEVIYPEGQGDELIIHYNDKDFPYLAEYPDKNVISVTTTVPDSINNKPAANTGLAYDFKRDEVIVFATPFEDHRRNLKMEVVSTLPNIGNQGVAYNSETGEYYMLWTTGIVVKDSTGKVKDTLKFPSVQPNPGMINYRKGKFYVSYDKGNVVNIWEGSPLRLTSISAPGAQEGAAADRDGNIWYNAIEYKVKIDPTGEELIRFPFKGDIGKLGEGLIVLPDGTVMFNIDRAYHGYIHNGNQTIHFDPEKTYGKFKRITVPDVKVWESEIFDFEGYNLQEDLQNWTLPKGKIAFKVDGAPWTNKPAKGRYWQVKVTRE